MNLRNLPCSCGSGKKTKKCCGNEADKAQRRAEGIERFNVAFRDKYQSDPELRMSRRALSTITLAATLLGGLSK